MFDKYRDYFDIDPEYFPQVNKELIEENPELWKKFYPHETFVKMLKDIISILSRKQKVSLWVEGAYGTGKSHAVLTMKKLLEVSEEETREYFDRFSNILSNDLFNSLQSFLQFIAMVLQILMAMLTFVSLFKKASLKHLRKIV